MKRQLIINALMCAAMLAVIACVTINVYFPEAEIKDMSQQIEDEIQRRAAEAQAGEAPAAEAPGEEPSTGETAPFGGDEVEAPPAGENATESSPGEAPPSDEGRSQGASLLDMLTGTTAAYAAEEVPDPGISNPAIRQIIKSRAGRVAALRKFKNSGVIGENNQALVKVIKLDALTDLKERAKVQRLVKAENADRERLFKEIAAANNVDLSQVPRIRETYAGTMRANAKPGDRIQMPDGGWKTK